MSEVELLQVTAYSPDTIEILDESVENELEEVQMTSTTECAVDSNLSSAQLPSESDTEMPVNLECSNSETTTQLAVDQTVNDLGALLLPSRTSAEITATMSKLSNSQKYCLLYNHISPPSILPSSYSYGCNRKFNTTWLQKYTWLRYSPKLDGVFCGPCALFAGENCTNKVVLVNRPFSNWVKITEALSKHAKVAYHHKALQDADILKSVIENPKSRIDILSSSVLQSRIQENKHIFGQIVRAILYLTKQGLALRGHRENLRDEINPGNFLALMKVFAQTDEILQSHLEKPRAKNATYLSSSSQNEIINVIGLDYIRSKIISEIKQAKFFSVIADEVSSHNVEHLSLCLRYIDGHHDIQEKHIAFVKLQRVRASDITNAIISTLEVLGISLEDLRGQCFDGASNMSGSKSGVQKRIKDRQPKAIYTHCASHSLSLGIVSSCSVPLVRNCIAHIKIITVWIKSSPKREGFLKAIVQKGIQSGIVSSRNPILNVCITRWVENIDGWERFCLSYPFMIQMFEAIIYGTSESDFESYNDGWTADDKTNAMAYLKAVTNFEFIYALVTLQRSLLYFREASVKLQGVNQDIASGIELIERCSTELKALRGDVSNYSNRIYSHSCRIANNSKVSIVIPRISRHQQHRPNYELQSVEEYFKVSIVIPFLDHLISELSIRFDNHTKQASHLQHLLPSRITEISTVNDIEQAINFYKDDLPNPSVVDEEFQRWKVQWLSTPTEDRPDTLNRCLKSCSPESIPNIFMLLKLFATLPMTSCSCERSASDLRRLNTYLRSTQSEERLTSLAIIHSNYSMPVDIDEVTRIFMAKHPRRMECPSLIYNE